MAALSLLAPTLSVAPLLCCQETLLNAVEAGEREAMDLGYARIEFAIGHATRDTMDRGVNASEALSSSKRVQETAAATRMTGGQPVR